MPWNEHSEASDWQPGLRGGLGDREKHMSTGESLAMDDLHIDRVSVADVLCEETCMSFTHLHRV